MIYGFAFTKRNISCVTLYSLNNLDHRYLLWGAKSIKQYCDLLLKNQPEYILGLGIYSGRDKDKIRIEQSCSNIFRAKLIDNSNNKNILINHYLQPTQNSKFADGIGTSYCNYVSYQIMALINSAKLNSRYTFLHIPRSFDRQIAIDDINRMIQQSVLKSK